MRKLPFVKHLAVQIMNLERIHETKKFSADNEKQTETEAVTSQPLSQGSFSDSQKRTI